MAYRRKRPIKKTYNNRKSCVACKVSAEFDYRQVESLAKYVSDRGKIVPRHLTGLCMSCQRRLATEVKRARHLARLPFVAQV